jgi:excinuclease ABC subunit C
MSINLGEVPSTPGIYKFFSKNKIIYIGKAKNLKKRVSSYFRNSISDRKTYQIKTLTDRLETFSTSSEAEALLLEQSLIKENLPRFNILLRDDKTYPYIYFSLDHSFPSISMKRTKHSVSKNFFGPFISSQAVKSTIKDMQKIYQIRNCSDSTFKNRSRPCIEYQMKRCSAPCVKYISQTDYLQDIDSSIQHISSSRKKIRKFMISKMRGFAEKQEFEKANEMKKRIKTFDLMRQDQSLNSYQYNLDIFTCISKLDKTGISIISIRDGKVRGTKTHYLSGNELQNVDSLFHSLIFSYYQNIFSLPEKIFLNPKPSNISMIKDAMKLKFGKNILISSSFNKTRKPFLKLAILNANQVIDNRMSKLEKYSFAIKDLKQRIGLHSNSFSIEGYDVSHQSGDFAVASLIKFSSEGPEKSSYRLYNIPRDIAGNDIGSIKHMLTRRIKNVKREPLPKIILIDGGTHQLNAALKVFTDNKIDSPEILSIAKGSNRIRATETIFSKRGIVEMPKDCPAFSLLQQARDESHRFAITANRNKKTKGVKYSVLDSIHGLGPKKKKALIANFQSLKNIRSSSIAELCMVDGISIKLANEIKKNI